MFKESFKYFKTKSPTPDLSMVIDFDQNSPEINTLDLSEECFKVSLPHGIRPIHTWRCFTLTERPGLIVIRNPFTAQGQRYWMARSLRDYPKKPNRVNLNEKLFDEAVISNWWQELQKNKDKDEVRRLKISMRWTTLGYHHNWDTKVYSEHMHTEFPKDLAKACKFFAQVLGFENFNAQAAIVNYYPIGTTLAGHTDHSEVNLNAPLFSFSFGQTAVFLIGGVSKDIKPTALFLRSGDVLIMSRESRLCYHAVPRVMKSIDEPWNELIPTRRNSSVESPNRKKIRLDCSTQMKCNDEWQMDMLLYENVANETFWAPFKSYLNDSRINMNVRQVLNASNDDEEFTELQDVK